MKILAAVVTYNRAPLLARCVDALNRQTRPPDHILVVNNGSSDDTEKILRGRNVDFVTQPNVGGAGGFSRAITEALEAGFDAVWLMDDDGYPDDAALEHLIGQMKSGVACASSVVLREYDRRNFVFPFPKLDREGFPAIFGWPRKVSALDQLRARSPDGVYPYAHFFNGCLIATGAIRKIGNVETRFFIFGDEVDYFMRLRSVGNVFSVLKAHHFHPDVSQRPLNELKFYYFVKNTFILNKRYMNWHSFRNVCTVGIAIARVAKRNGIITAASYVAGSRVHILAKSIARGIKGNLGNDF